MTVIVEDDEVLLILCRIHDYFDKYIVLFFYVINCEFFS